MKRLKAAFTLIELLIVVGILGVLFAIVLVAINPARQFAQSRNTTRKSNVLAILNAIGQYMAENKGLLPAGITTSPQNISNTGANLCSNLIPTYLSALPVDPQSGNPAALNSCAGTYNTNYQVYKDSSNRVTVLAPTTEIAAPTISVTR
jgi:prepilin-type N-terminal cleavage/methylation domain-containing protein